MGPGSSDGSLQEGWRKVLLQHGRASRQLRPVELEVHALERGEHGAEEGRSGPVAKSGAQSRSALWRQRASVDQLQMVLREPWRRQDRANGRCFVRRRRSALRRPLSRCRVRAVHRQAGLERRRHSRFVAAALSQPHDRSHRQVSPRHSLHRRPSSFRGIRPENGFAPLQRKRPLEWRQSRSGLHEQRVFGLRRGHMRSRSRARRGGWHRGESLANRYMHRTMALQARRSIQDARRK